MGMKVREHMEEHMVLAIKNGFCALVKFDGVVQNEIERQLLVDHEEIHRFLSCII